MHVSLGSICRGGACTWLSSGRAAGLAEVQPTTPWRHPRNKRAVRLRAPCHTWWLEVISSAATTVLDHRVAEGGRY
jgi:hypothetical protein